MYIIVYSIYQEWFLKIVSQKIGIQYLNLVFIIHQQFLKIIKYLWININHYSFQIIIAPIIFKLFIKILLILVNNNLETTRQNVDRTKILNNINLYGHSLNGTKNIKYSKNGL